LLVQRAEEWRRAGVEDERVRLVLLDQGPGHYRVGGIGDHRREPVAQLLAQ
jgi:hypothetical protein